jgi:Mitochondrial ribosomal protein (VAR1)
MTKTNNNSSLSPLFGNINNTEKSKYESNKFFSYKNIFNKNILWVKLYDNYLYLYLNKNTRNNISILEPKTKVYTEANQTLVTASSPALSSVGRIEGVLALTQAEGANVQISKNTIKLINTNINKINSSTLLSQATSPTGNVEVKKEIIKNIRSISKLNSENIKYKNIVYQFNKNNKGVHNNNVGINKNVFTLLESTFLTMSSLISKPKIVITPNKVVIQLFYYLNKYYSNKTLLNNSKLQSLCLNLSKIYNKPVELELERLHYPYYDSNILSNMIGLISNIIKFRFIIKKLFYIAKIRKTNKSINKYSIIPSYLSGFKIRVAGRLLTQRVIPRLTVKTIQRGSLTRSKAQFIDSARFSNTNKRGSFSITVTMGHIFF